MPSDYNVGSASLSIVPNLKGFSSKLRAELRSELAAIDGQIEIAVTADTSRLVEQVEAARAAIKAGGPISIRLDLDTDRALGEAEAFRALAGEDVEVKVDLDTAAAAAKAEAFRAAAGAEINVDIDANTAAATAKIAALRAQGSNDIDIRVDADTSSAQQKMNGLRAGAGLGGGGIGVGMFTAATAAVTALSAEIMGLVGAAGAAVTALGAVGATAMVGFSGVLGAFQAFKANSDAAATSAGSAAQSQVSAANRVMDAQNQVAQSHERVRDAQTTLKNSQDKLNQSYRDASRDIRDMNNQLQSAELSQEASAIAVARAKERQAKVKADFRTGKASALDMQEANLDVKQSQQRLTESQAKVKDQRVDTAEANAKGIGGNDKVKTARQAVDSAQSNLSQAIYQQGAATRQLAEAQMAAANAGGTMATAQRKLDAALAKLSPNAKDFVLQVRALGGEWKKLQQAVQERMFQGLGDEVTRVAKNQLPELQRGMVVLAGTVNGVMMDTMGRLDKLFTKFSQDGTFDKFLTSVTASFKGFAPFVEGAANAMTQMTIGAGPQLGVMFEKLGKALEIMGPSLGTLGGAFAEHLGNLALGFAVFIDKFEPTFRMMFPLVEQVLGALGKVLIENQEPLQRFITAFADLVTKGLAAFSPYIDDILNFFSMVMEFISGLDPSTLGEIIALFLAFKVATNVASGIGQVSRMVAVYKSLGTTLIGVGKNAAGMATGMARGVQGLASAAKDYWNWTGKARLANAGQATKNFGSKVAEGAKTVGSKAVDIGQTVISGAGNLATKAGNIGKTVATGLANGIKSGLSTAGSAISSGLTTALNASKGAASAAGTALKTGLAAGANAARVSFAFLTALPGRIVATTLATKLAGAATKVWAGIQAAFNIVMSANPIALVVIAIAALAAGIIYAYKNSETFRKICDALLKGLRDGWEVCWAAVKPVLENLWEFIKKLGDIFTDVVNIFVSLFKGDFSGVFNGMRKLGEDVASAIGSAFKGIGNVMLTPFRALGGLLAGLPDKVLGVSIPGVSTIRSWGQKMQSVKLAEGGVVPAGRKNGVLFGPGTGTSDSIQGVGPDGKPTAQVSAGEFVVNADATAKNLPELMAINSGQKLKDGGVVGYGLPAGTGDTGADGFPPWVKALGERFGVTPSTYANHQTSTIGDGGEAFGYRSNPENLNRGIDWGGTPDAMQKFAEYLMTLGPDSGLEQVIWQNPNTGQKLGRAGTRDVSGDDPYYNYDGGYNGHTDHVHTRFFQELQEAKPDEGQDTSSSGDSGKPKRKAGEAAGDGEDGTAQTQTLEDDTEAEASSTEGVEGFNLGVFSVDGGLTKLGNMIGESFAPKGSILNPGDQHPAAKYGMPDYTGITPGDAIGKGMGIIGSGILAFFGLENSILSSSGYYNSKLNGPVSEAVNGYTGKGKKGKNGKGKTPVKSDYDNTGVDPNTVGKGDDKPATNSAPTDPGPTDAEIEDAEKALEKVKADRDKAELNSIPLTPGATAATTGQKDMRSPEEFATAIKEAEERLDELKGRRKAAQDAAAATKGGGALKAPDAEYSGGSSDTHDKVYAAFKEAGFPDEDWPSLVKMINRESSWNPEIRNPSSDAYGIFQFLTQGNIDKYLGGKNRDVPVDVQAKAGMQYIKDRYETPAKAWDFWQTNGWYADGGPVAGPGGPRDDKIRAMLSNGEYVINAQATSQAPTAVAAINGDPNAAKAIEEHVTGGPQPLGPGGQGRSKSVVGAVAQGAKGWASSLMDQGQAVAGSAVSSAVSGVAAGAGGAAAGPAGFGIAQAAGAAKLGMDIGARFAEKFAGTLGSSLGFTGNEAKNMWTAFNSGSGLPGEEQTQGTAPVAKKTPDQAAPVDRSVNYGDVQVGNVQEFLDSQNRQEAQRNQAYFPGH